MANTRTFPDGYSYDWLTDLAAKGIPVEPGYDGIVFVQPAQVMRLVVDGNNEDIVIISVSREPLERLSAEAIDSDGNSVSLPAIGPSGEFAHSSSPTRTEVDGPGREVGKAIAERYLGGERPG